MIYNSTDMEMQAALHTATLVCAAARTAPKAHGKDMIHTFVLTGEDKERLAQIMETVGTELMGDEMNTWYGRDALNVRQAQAVVLIGAEKKERAVPHCGFCGLENCERCAEAGGQCGFTYIDLGIAMSSAAQVAAQHNVDCRIMYSVGKAASRLALHPNCLWLGIPLSISGKNIFFDRGIFHK